MKKIEIKALRKTNRHIKDETMAAFVGESLAAKKQSQVQRHLQDCHHCFENMARLRKSLTVRETLEFIPTPEEFIEEAKLLAVKQEGFLKIAYKKVNAKIATLIPSKSTWEEAFVGIWNVASALFRWRVAIPALATVTIAVFIAIMWPFGSPIKNYSMGNQLIISEIGPLGFVGEREVMEYKDMKVKLSDDRKNLIFSWQEVAGAKFYHINLIVDSEKQGITPLMGIQGTSFSYPLQGIMLNTKYTWEISGKLEDGRSFRARASFAQRK